MKCPYQTRVIHKPERKEGYVRYFAEDITEFCECVENECPFYYKHTTGHCRKVENEVEK